MRYDLLEMMDNALNGVKITGIIERMNSKFVRMVHESSLINIMNSLKRFGVSPETVEREIIHMYQQEMMLKTEAGLKHLTTAEGFDRLSYSIFKVFFKKVDPLVRKEEGAQVTEKIGHDIFDWFDLKLELYNDYSNLPGVMKKICQKFIEVGYYTDANVLTKVKNKHAKEFYFYEPGKLKKGEKTHIGYVMANPVIYPSAVQLFQQYQVAQHFSSRTIQAYLEKMNLNGGEIDFNPGEHSQEKVVELWWMQKMDIVRRN